METWGYACALANLTNEEVHLVAMMQSSGGSKGAATRVRVMFDDEGVMMVDKAPLGREPLWIPIRAGEELVPVLVLLVLPHVQEV